MEHFNNQFGERCKNLAIHICRFLKKMPYDISTKKIKNETLELLWFFLPQKKNQGGTNRQLITF
jgi:hypothetical protein